MSSAPFIEVREVSKEYQRGGETIHVLDHITLTIERGEFVALMGPSGSGKTTLLNIIAGLDRPDSGAVYIQGQKTSALNESALTKWRAQNIGFIFQFYNLIPVLSALENVALPLGLQPLTAAQRDQRAKAALELVGLDDRLDHLPAELSGGQEQRVAIARALVTNPGLLVADEPTGDLDRQSAQSVVDLFQRLNRDEGKTIVMVTHDHVTAAAASRIVQLDKGKLLL